MMKFYISGKEDQDQFKITGLYGVPFADEDLAVDARPRAAKEQPHLLRQIVEHLDAITYAFEVGSGMRYVSPQASALGESASSWLGDPARHADLIHPDDRDEALAYIQHSLATGTPVCFEYRLLNPDGRYTWYRHQTCLSDDIHQATFTLLGTLTRISGDKQAELAASKVRKQLQAVTTLQDEVKRHERHRIAQDLHDELGGLLTCINACISVSLERVRQRGETPDVLLSDACQMAKDAIGAVQQIATSLRPGVLDRLGIWAAIEDALDTLEKHTGIDCSCEIEPALNALALDANTELALYRIMQEALTNVRRHAKANRVHVQARCGANGLRLTISDNGVGIQPDSQRERTSWGIIGMQERAARLNGSLALVAGEQGGTKLVLDLPLEAEDGA